MAVSVGARLSSSGALQVIAGYGPADKLRVWDVEGPHGDFFIWLCWGGDKELLPRLADLSVFCHGHDAVKELCYMLPALDCVYRYWLHTIEGAGYSTPPWIVQEELMSALGVRAGLNWTEHFFGRRALMKGLVARDIA